MVRVKSKNKNWSIIISPRKNLLQLNISEIWAYKDLIKMFIVRDFVTFYKQTILGPAWFIIQPLFTAAMVTFVFGRIANISTEGVPHILFYMAGIINWTYFADCLSKTSDTFIVNSPIFGRIYFPRLTVPIATVFTNMIRYIIQYSIFIGIYLTFIFKGYKFGYDLKIILLTPILLLYMASMSLGFGIWISSLTTKYRDLRFAFPFFIQLWMYATPIIYPLSIIPEKYQNYLLINPVIPIVEIFRKAYFGQGFISINQIFLSVIITTIVFITGIIIFNRVEKTFMDTI
ncbi:MAG: ABC transporter permease [Spirochaetes bacterium]|nr:ABC transporter permease [Spirochaetota bacterium]